MTKKDLDLLKAGLRRAFSRSDLRRSVLDASITDHTDLSRPKVKTWCKCASCGKPEAKSYMDVDHIIPFVPLDRPFADLTNQERVDRLWCDTSQLQVLCPTCHTAKSKEEAKKRAAYRTSQRPPKPPKVKRPSKKS